MYSKTIVKPDKSILNLGDQGMKMTKILLSLSALLFLAGSVLADPVGTLSLEKGNLKLRRNHVDTIYKAPAANIPVQNHDELQTSRDTRAKLDLTAKSDRIELFSSTFFVISAVEPEKSEFKMPLGKARFKIAKSKRSGKSRRFRLRTANALVGVKGTEFVVGVSGGDTNLLTLSGIVNMASLAAPEVQVEVQANQASKIQKNQAPTPPVVVSPEVQESIVESDSVEEFNAVEFGDAPDVGTDSQEQQAPGDEGKMSDEEAVETVDVGEEVNTDELIEELTETIDDVQEDIDNSDTGTRSIEFKIIKN